MYKHWRGPIYPNSLPARQWFAFYASLFDTVEINNTFYRLPSDQAVDGWARQAPSQFVYALKLGSFGSHRKKLRDAESWLPNHLDRVSRLGSSLGPTLIQLPPRWQRNAERLDEFFDAAPSTLRWAVEFREPSWLHDDIYALLRKHGAALCIHDLLADHPWELTTNWTYLRFHGPHAVKSPYRGSYSSRRLGRIAEQIAGWSEKGIDTYAYFNNDDSGFAVKNGRWLVEHLPSSPDPAVVVSQPNHT